MGSLQNYNSDQQEEKIRLYADVYLHEENILFLKEISISNQIDFSPLLNELTEKIENDEISCILVCELEVLTKDLNKLNDLLQLCLNHNTRFISIFNDIETTFPTGQLLLQSMSTLVESQISLVETEL